MCVALSCFLTLAPLGEKYATSEAVIVATLRRPGATGDCRMFETVADLLAQERDSSTALVAPVKQRTVGRRAQGPKMRRRGQNVRLA